MEKNPSRAHAAPWPALVACLAAFALLLGCRTPARVEPRPPQAAAGMSGEAAFPEARARTLILFDTSGEWAYLGDLYAQEAANLASHFGAWTAMPVTRYAAGDLRAFTAAIYLGTTYGEPLPAAFLADVAEGSRPVLWAGENLWQLAPDGSPAARNLGFTVRGYDHAPLTSVAYKGTDFDRAQELAAAGLPAVEVLDPSRVAVLAAASGPGGTARPWAVRGGGLTYLADAPFSWTGPDDRYLVFADLLFDLLAPSTPSRHRALVRLEDVGPDSDPKALAAIADLLAARKIPFSVAVYPLYRDPLGAYHGRRETAKDLAEAPDVLGALAHMRAQGGTLIMHGASHQLGRALNPYSAASADDFEFYGAHLGPAGEVVLDGPVPGDSRAWAASRVQEGLAAFKAAGLAAPALFEPPHYAASAEDYLAFREAFEGRYDRGLYFPGLLAGGKADASRGANQFFPYLVRDVYGSLVVPENLGNVVAREYNFHAPRQPADLLRTAARNLAVRDGYASFFYHPALGTGPLVTLLDGLQAQGWTFVSADEARRR